MYKNYFDFKKKKITLVELLTCVISIGAFIVSIFALYDSCTANKRATHNANTINRIECRNMIASETPELLESYLIQNGDRIDTLFLLAQISSGEGDSKSALDYLGRALKIDPQNQSIQSAIQQLLFLR